MQSDGNIHRHTLEQLVSRFGDLIDGMGSTMFTMPSANLTMEEWNLLERADGMLTSDED